MRARHLARPLRAAVAAGAVLLAVASPAAATQITPPGGGESFNIRPGDSFRVGYDFTIPGNSQAVTVKWTNPKAVVDFTCGNGGSGSFTIPMPDYTVTVSDSQWYPSGDQHSPLVYQGSITAPDGCGDGSAMHQNHIATFTADVSSSPSGVTLHYRFHDVDNDASGSWSSTESVQTSPITQTIQGEIYLCVNGAPSTTLVSGGTVAVPGAGLSSANPLAARQVAAGTYAMDATVSPSYKFVACGQAGVAIGTPPTSASQSVTVPTGSAGDGKFYVVTVSQTIQGEIYRCVNGAPSTTLISGGTVSVPSAGLSSANPLTPKQVAAGTYTMNATVPSGLKFVACGQSGVSITTPTSASQSVTVPVGGAGDGKFYATTAGSGFVEVCKSEANGVTGAFDFTVNGTTVSVPAGACSPAIKVPAGNLTVHEVSKTGFTMVSASTAPSGRLVSVDAAHGNAVVKIVAGNISTQTVVTFVNKPVSGTIKVCQVAGTGVAAGTLFTFTNSANAESIQVPAGSAPGGLCKLFSASFTGGEQVTISQTIPDGDQVSSIAVAPANRLVGTPDRANGKVTVVVGKGVTEVTYTDTRPTT